MSFNGHKTTVNGQPENRKTSGGRRVSTGCESFEFYVNVFGDLKQMFLLCLYKCNFSGRNVGRS